LPKIAHVSIDEELAQSKARFIISAIVALLGGIFSTRSGYVSAGTMAVAFQWIFSYLTFSGLWYLLVRRYPGRWPWRRNISLISDIGVMSAFLQLGGKQVSLLYPLFLWIIIGNGIRFGEKFLTRGIVLGVAGFGWVLVSNSYWKVNLEMGLGLWLGIIILPIFFLGVLRRLEAVHQLRLELARSREADKAKDQFLAAMSHELRTPMNGVLGMAEILNTTNLDRDQKGYLQVITRSVESLLNVINDVLDYSKITARRLSLEAISFDLSQVINDVVELVRNVAREKGVNLDLHYPPGAQRYFVGDPTRVRQIVFNLVGNAVKFTEEGSVLVEVNVLDETEGPNVVIMVSDTGVGIPEERLEAIFDHFEQADNSTTRKFGGTGLGLAISRQLAGMMGGSIEVNSTLGEGSVFTTRLALKPGEAPEVVVEKVDEELPDFGIKALVVEDNKFNQVVIRNILQRIGVETRVAENGLEALDALDTDDFDVVFMDVRMPEMNGYDATRAIRGRTDAKGRIPILALTGEATRADVQKCLEAGMDLHLAKPIRMDKIVSALRDLPQLSACGV